MLTVRTTAALREALAPAHLRDARIGLVPTMGALHDGHLSLLRHGRGACDVLVMSLFVNPRQFTDAGDLAHYPRDEARDLALADAAGVDIAFVPAPESVYPPGFATTVSVGGPADGLEGAHRGRAHFDGVATVVTKLLIAVGPHAAWFGEKDAQQLAVIRRLVADLDLPTAIEGRPTVREPDGLALSSRNVLLDPGQRACATALHAALQAVRNAIGTGAELSAATAAGRTLLAAAGAELDYLEVVDPATMAPLARLDRDGLAVVAARIGAVRLIDNLPVPLRRSTPQPVATSSGASTA